MCCWRRVLLSVALLCCGVVRAAEPTAAKSLWTLPMIGAGDFTAEHVASICSHREQKKLYVGGLSRDVGRSGLWVYDLDANGQPHGQPRKYSDHPDELPVGQHSTPVCMLLDAAKRRLYLGVHGSHPTHARGLVMYSLDERGEPIGKPEAFDHGNAHKACDAILIHPQTGKLLAVGWGGEGFFVVERDADGRPTGKGTQQRFGGYGSRSLGLRSDGSKLYRGTYPSAIEVVDLDAQGRLVGTARSTSIPNGPKEYAKIVVTDRAVYFVGPDQRLSWFALDDKGEIHGAMHAADVLPVGVQSLQAKGTRDFQSVAPIDGLEVRRTKTPTAALQAVAASERLNHLVIAVATGFDDAVTGKPIVDGVSVREIALNADGSPGATVRETAPFARAAAVNLNGGSNAALAAKSLGRAFLGNRLSGLKVRVRLDALETTGTTLPLMKSVRISDEPGYLRFEVSRRHGLVYAIGKDELVTVNVAFRSAKGRSGKDGVTSNTASVASVTEGAATRQRPLAERKATLNATNILAVDEQRGRLFVALKDGSVAVFKLDERGFPTEQTQTLKSGLSQIGKLLVHPSNGSVHAIGIPLDAPSKDGAAASDIKIIAIPAGSWVNDAVLDAKRGRLYVVSAYQGLQNLSVWKLQADGSLAEKEPTRFADGLRGKQPNARGMLESIVLDEAKRQLVIAGHVENPTNEPSFLLVWKLDEHGDPNGGAQAERPSEMRPSGNQRGSVQALEVSTRGDVLYESGWGDSHVYRHTQLKGGFKRERWNVGTYGKRQLTLLLEPESEVATSKQPRASVLLAGTHPSELEIIPLDERHEPTPAAFVDFSCDGILQKLGLLGTGETSQWVDLDKALQNGIGPTVARVTLNGTTVEKASLHWEVARQVGETLEPIRDVKLELIGNVGALIVPKYGTDAVSNLTALPSLIKTSAEEFARYRRFAVEHTVSPSERPEQFGVANGLIGLDSSSEALDAGMETLALLGHNTAQIWNWPGIAPEKIRETALKYGIKRFRTATYNPPSYFHFNTELVQPESLDKWAAGFRETAASMGAKPEEVELMHMGDEPGWYFPKVTDDVRNDPRRLAVFREYLQSKGLSPADVGAAKWEEVLPGKLSAVGRTVAAEKPGQPARFVIDGPLPQRRLFYWTARFYAESLSVAFGAATQALQRQVNPKLLTTTNLNNWPGRFYIASPGAKLANNSNAGPDAGMGMPDWFDLGRKKAISCIWTEDWFGDSDAQLWSLYGDLLRCAAREGGIEYGGYPVGQSTGAMRDGMKLKIASLIGHGAKTIDPYIFGPHLAFADGWSEKEVTYRNLSEAMRVIGKAERVLAPGRPRDGSIAIVFPQASQIWDGDSPIKCYQQELYGLHAALIHSHFKVDFIDDYSLEAGDLQKRKYATVYVTAPNLSLKAQRALKQWAEAGGTLVLAPGACAADEYNEPTHELRALIGATQAEVSRVHPPHHSLAARSRETGTLIVDRQNTFGASATDPSATTTPQPNDLYAVTQTVPLVPTNAKTLATFADGSVSVSETTFGKGRLIALGFWPGVTYWLSPDRTDHSRLPTNWSEPLRRLISWPATSARATQQVIVSEPGVEACLLESPQGTAVTLLNWTGEPIAKLKLTIPGVTTKPHLTTVEQGPLNSVISPGGLEVTLPLNTVDILLLKKP